MRLLKFITAAQVGYLLCAMMMCLDGHTSIIFPGIAFPFAVIEAMLVWHR